MEKNIKVSVVIPMYNVEKYIGDCLDSVINQTLSEMEIICVDDGSSDHTVEIVNKYIQKDKRIKLIKQKNMYAGVARNRGMESARGQYLLFCDGDDFYEKEAFLLMYQKCIETDADICVCNADKFNIATGQFENWNKLLLKYTPKEDVFSKKELKTFLFDFLNSSPCDRMYKREFVENNQLRFQEVHHANDVFFSSMALVEAEKITILDSKPLYHYRVGMSSNLQSSKKKNPLCSMEAFKAILESLKENKLDTEEVMGGYVNSLVRNVMWNLDIFAGSEKELAMILSYYQAKFVESVDLYRQYLAPYLLKTHNVIKTGNDLKLVYENFRNVKKSNESKKGKLLLLKDAVAECGITYMKIWVCKQLYVHGKCRW